MRNWLLPENLEDILPPQAQRIDRMRAQLLELFRVHGYQLVIPPLLEYLESLLTGTGHDLDLRTFKLVDQLSGRMMGVRADIAPQVARIDAHLLNSKDVTRLCYAGSVLLTRPRGLASTREPLQIGAEIYGHAGIESDLEIQQLLVDSLAACGISEARLDVGHVAVFRAICRHGGVAAELESDLYEALEGKDLPALRVVTQSMPKATRNALLALPELYGDGTVLDRARRALPKYAEIDAALKDLKVLSRSDSIPVSVDLADLRGITTTAEWCLRPTRRVWRTRSRSAGATTKSERHSGALGPRRDSAWTCATLRALRRTRRAQAPFARRTPQIRGSRQRSASCEPPGRSSWPSFRVTRRSALNPNATASSSSAPASGS